MQINGQATMSIIQEKSREQPRLKLKARWRIGLALAVAIAIGGVALYKLQQAHNQATAPKPVASTNPVAAAVTALGRLEPQGEVIDLSAPSSTQAPRVEQILVREGKRVKAGQVVAILDNRTRATTNLEHALAEVAVARAELTRVKAGAQTGEITAQQARIAQLEAELQGQIQILQATLARTEAERRNAQTEYQRYVTLYNNGAISAQELETKRLSAETTTQQVNESEATRNEKVASLQRQIEEAKATLDKITEVRPTDVQVATAEIERASAAVKQAQADLALSVVKAPISGEIIEIYTQPGETIGTDGIAQIGRTEQMVVVAEVLEEDIGKVRLGQRATITSENETFAGKLQGTVSEIARQIGKQDVLNSDPAADVDARVVEVKIGLAPEASQRVSGLTYANVVVEIRI